jgi:hypothetical protein
MNKTCSQAKFVSHCILKKQMLTLSFETARQIDSSNDGPIQFAANGGRASAEFGWIRTKAKSLVSLNSATYQLTIKETAPLSIAVSKSR